MTDFYFTELVNDPLGQIETAALGVSTSTDLTDADVGKAVKLAANQNYVLCATGDDIEGFVSSMQPDTVNSGFSHGAVQRAGRKVVEVAAAQGATPIAIGAEVVSGVPVTLNTAGNAMVIAGTGTLFKWRVLRHVTGTGIAGNLILIERI